MRCRTRRISPWGRRGKTGKSRRGGIRVQRNMCATMNFVDLPSANSEAATAAVVRLSYAGFWIRLFAGLIDFTILLIPFSTIVSFAAMGMNVWYSFFFNMRPGQPLPEDLARKGPILVLIGVFVFILASWLYFAFLESSAWRGTLGKHMLGIYVGDGSGEAIGFWKATQRFLGGRFLLHVPVVGIYYFIVDCVCIAFIPRNRAIHDVLAGCLVLRELKTPA
jgi:uncharacterized RDD family membrane protein YckC